MALIQSISARYGYVIASVAGLLAALFAFSFVMVKAVSAIGMAGAGLCHDRPALSGSVDQKTFVGVCVATFVAGYLVSWAGARSRSELYERLGHGTWGDLRTVITVKTALALFLLLLTLLMALEAWMLHLGIWPITLYVRCSNEANSYIALVGAGTYTFLAGRWFWIPR